MSLTGSDRSEIQKIAKKEIEAITKKEMEKFLKTTNAHKLVIQMVQKELGTNKKITDRVVELSSKVVTELFKTLWQRKSFWEGPIKRVK